jgi:hypothetical protein
MGLLSSFTDATGSLSDTEVNAQNISNIIDELNRNGDQLDSLSNNMSIASASNQSFFWNGSPQDLGVTATASTGTANTFYAFYTRSDIPNNLYSVPDYQFNSAGNLLYSVTVFTGGEGGPSDINFTFDFVQGGTPATYTVYYFLLNQPISQSGL